MAEIKLTKNALRAEQIRLGQLEKYLPTLQLKKAMLQAEVASATSELAAVNGKRDRKLDAMRSFQSLLTDPFSSDLFETLEILDVKRTSENIAGVDIPYLDEVIFIEPTYPLYDSPLWVDQAMEELRALICIREEIKIVQEKRNLLKKELREVSIRVNLFEKILIPRTLANIKKIKVFLGDQQLAAVSQAKIAKQKIERKKALHDY